MLKPPFHVQSTISLSCVSILLLVFIKGLDILYLCCIQLLLVLGDRKGEVCCNVICFFSVLNTIWYLYLIYASVTVREVEGRYLHSEKTI